MTGTAAGMAEHRGPPVALARGDTVEIEAEIETETDGIGTLASP